MWIIILFYRRKVLLALLERFNNNLTNTELQKYLFLLSREQIKNKLTPSYDFIPYKYGCFSIQSYSDRDLIEKQNLINGTLFENTNDRKYMKEIKPADLCCINRVFDEHHDKRGKELISFVYKNYPYYAVKSEIADKVLSQEDLSFVRSTINTDNSHALFTIGYEGISLEEYLNKLVKNNVKVVIDVRKNPTSMKFGFSKGVLKDWLTRLGIKYTHIPQLGIESDKRLHLQTQSDYDDLFEYYKNTVLKESGVYLNQIYNTLKEKHRIALTCFEKKAMQCHRSVVAKSVIELDTFNINCKVKDI